MKNFWQEYNGYFWSVFWIAFVSGLIWLVVHAANVQEKECNDQVYSENSYAQLHPEVYDLVALFGETRTTTKSSFSGGFFLMMGGIDGSTVQSSDYMLKYAYVDSYGTKLMVEKVANDSKIRILEANNVKPVLKIYRCYEKQYGPSVGNCDPMKVFEVPTGTIFKGYGVNLTK